MAREFWKYHGLGNDYIVLDPASFDQDLTAELTRAICHRNFGVGSDGILLGPLPNGRDDLPNLPSRRALPAQTDSAEFAVRILNPDGSEAEKSGNGLRIFARFLHDTGRVGGEPFAVATLGGMVRCQIFDPNEQIRIDMGAVSFSSRDIPVTGDDREVLEEQVETADGTMRFSAATVGNPHCVLVRDQISKEQTCRLGPALETDPRFPNRTNVQFLQVLDRQNIRIEIWERGAGYTLASGSSSSAAAAVAHRLGLCDGQLTVHSPGGTLQIEIDEQNQIRLTGPVGAICHGELDTAISGG